MSNLGQEIVNSATDTKADLDLFVMSTVSPYTLLFSETFSTDKSFSSIVTASFSGTVRVKHNGSQSDILFGSIDSIVNGHKYLIVGNVAGHNPTTVNGIKIKDFIFRDITTIFPDLPSTDLVTSNIPNLVKLCPDLLKYDAYGQSIVDTTVEGVKSVGVNIWPEEWELGGYDSTTGQPYSTSDRIRTKNPISVTPNTQYYINAPNDVKPFFYDGTGNFVGTLSSVHDTYVTTPSNAAVMRFYVVSAYGATYKNDIQICLNSLPDAVKTTYHPYMTDTLSLPTPFAGKSAGSVADTDELNVEVLVDGQKVNKRRQTKKVGQVDMGTLTWNYESGENYFMANLPADSKSQDYTTLNGLCSRYPIKASSAGWANMAEKTFGLVLKQVRVKDSSYSGDTSAFKTAMSGVMLNYELADESVTLVDPIENNTIRVEGNGTIETVQTQTPVLDNSMTVNFDLIP